jgi:hypothetical protein
MAAVEVVMRVMARLMEQEVLGAPELPLELAPKGIDGRDRVERPANRAQMRA